MPSNVKPVGQRLLVLPLKKKESKLTDSDLIIPETAYADLNEGKVVSVSSEVAHLYKKDDIVLYPSKKGVGMIIDNVPHLWLSTEVGRDEVWGILQST
jgi:co-chaperonin GroES (HSP10)